MRTAILGGTFDPVHLGHLLIADEVLCNLEYEQILFVPNHQAPHKDRTPRVDGAERVHMLRLATEDRPEFHVETYEVDQEGVSFTVDTLRHVMRTWSVTGKPGLIIGSDLANGFSTWRSSQTIAELAELIVVRRPGSEDSVLSYPHRTVDNMMLPISSSQIRSRAYEGGPYRYVLPPVVFEYIRSRSLYQEPLAE